MDKISPELIKWLIGACGGVIVFLSGLAGLVIRATYKLGHYTARTEAAANKVEQIERLVEKIPMHETRLGILENVVTSIRSDIKELLRGPRRSSPSWDSET